MFRMEDNGLLDESLELKDEIAGNSSDSDIQILDDDDNNGQNTGENESFVVDTSAQHEIGTNVGLDAECFNSSNIISHVYNGPDKNGERRSKGGRRSGQACFNCNSLEHPARDCPHPPNQRRISQNRNSFIKRREGSGRFHEDAEKEKEIVPGKISEKLREALGIDGRELPEWIYRMRKLGSIDGYPPGYRKIAIEESSIFEFHEGTTSSTNRKRKHDANNHLAISREKIIKYPGFNFDDGSYRDQRREKYPIPKFDDFINEQQTFLMQMDALKRKNEAMEETQIKKRKTDEGNSMEINLIEEELDVLIVKTRRSSGSIEDGEIRENAGQIIEEEEETTNITIRKKKKKKSKSKKTETNGTQSSTSKNNSQTNVEAEMENNKGEELNEDENNKNEELNDEEYNKNEELIEEEATIPIMETSIPLIEDEDLPSSSQQNGNNEDMKPSLDSFAQGIQPFQHQAPGTSHGFIKRLHEIIKKTRKN